MKSLQIVNLTCIILFTSNIAFAQSSDYKRIKYNHPGLVVDLHVGLWAWPIPVDFDKDGDMDLLVSCPDVPYAGFYFFENADGSDFPTFKPPVRLSDKIRNISPSYVNGELRLLTPAKEVFLDKKGDISHMNEIYHTDCLETGFNKMRANQWKYVDYEGDGDQDLLVGHGIWDDYGWDNAFNEKGEWTRGPLHGYTYIVINEGTDKKPEYAKPEKIMAGSTPADVYGMPSPCMEDFDGDGDLDLICGEFVDSFTWFENIGSRKEPSFVEGRKLISKGEIIRMDLEMIVVTSIDWDKDGDVDLVVGQEDGRIAFIENTGKVKDNMPVFNNPRFFKQEADDLFFGALATPWSVDWDDDGDEDLICGNTAGYIGFIENLSGGVNPKWAEPVYLEIDNKPIRIMAGYNGSIQGPCEAKWGYTVLSVGDWDGDGLNDIVANSIKGTVVWYKNVGIKGNPQLAPVQNIEVAWNEAPPKPAWRWRNPGKTEMSAPWRTTPVINDIDKDGITDLVILDTEGYLSFFKGEVKAGRKIVLPGERIFKSKDGVMYDRRQNVVEGNSDALMLNPAEAGGSGRRKICFADWNNDGKDDLILNSIPNINWLENVGEDGEYVFTGNRMLGERRLAGHTTSPTIVDWNKDGIQDLLVGAEDGCFYYLENPRKGKKWTGPIPKIAKNLTSIAEKFDNYDVVLQPEKNEAEWWAGAPSVVRDEKGTFWMAARMRSPEHPRGLRGYEIRILKSKDGINFEQVHQIQRQEVPIPGFERPALVIDPETKKFKLYACGPWEKGPWAIIKFDDVEDPTKFDPSTAKPVIQAPEKSYERDVSVLEYKDPYVIYANGEYHCYVIGYIRRNERLFHFTSEDGEEWSSVGDVNQPVMDLTGWHNFFIRPASVLPLGIGYLFAYEGSSTQWYDPVYNIGTGFGFTFDLHNITDLTIESPVAISSTPGDFYTWRYSDWLWVDGDIWIYAEVANENNSHEIRRFVVRIND